MFLQDMIRTWFGGGTTYVQRLTRTSTAALSSMYHIIFWPVEMHRRKFISETRWLTSHGEERVKARLESEDATVLSSRSQMIEVCSESSFQPLLQLYLFLPTLIVLFSNLQKEVNFNQSVGEIFTNISNLQFWSIVTSCTSLAWSFTFYQSTKKRGALDFSINPVGRALMLFSNAFQISSRLVAFALFAYSWGDGNFWPAFVFVLLHILIMAAFHFDAGNKDSWVQCKSYPSTWVRFKSYPSSIAVWQSLLNGISNLYMNNQILPLPTKEKKKQPKHSERSSFKRQLITDGLFVWENSVIVVIAVIRLNIEIVWPLLVFVFAGQLCGILLKLIYYRFFHIWSSIMTNKDIDV